MDVESRAVSVDEAKAYALEKGLMYAETSAKTGVGIQEMFQKIGERCHAAGSAGQSRSGSRFPDIEPPKEKSCACG